jgi:hypothetical protein
MAKKSCETFLEIPYLNVARGAANVTHALTASASLADKKLEVERFVSGYGRQLVVRNLCF